ncbi:prepilin peptidase [Candidatus Poriferisodalis sp.]|uniref:prepilin peptidase n=1 Tax=Candidatus Poriferisodalis sp. TaxID=3101277 RepID=UPI003B01BA3E
MIAEASVWAAIGTWALLGLHASFTDLRSATISRRACWTAGSAIAALLLAAAMSRAGLLRWAWTLGGAGAVALLLEIVYRTQPDKIGYGDVRLIVVNSLLLAWWGPGWPWWALLAGSVVAVPAAVRSSQRDGREGRVRWAPGLAAGTALIIAWLAWTAGPLG